MKKKKKLNIEPMIESVEKNVDGSATVKMVMVHEPRYRNIPIDAITHKRLMALCEKRGFGQRGQGALVRILINSSYEAEFAKKKA